MTRGHGVLEPSQHLHVCGCQYGPGEEEASQQGLAPILKSPHFSRCAEQLRRHYIISELMDCFLPACSSPVWLLRDTTRPSWLRALRFAFRHDSPAPGQQEFVGVYCSLQPRLVEAVQAALAWRVDRGAVPEPGEPAAAPK